MNRFLALDRLGLTSEADLMDFNQRGSANDPLSSTARTGEVLVAPVPIPRSTWLRSAPERCRAEEALPERDLLPESQEDFGAAGA